MPALPNYNSFLTVARMQMAYALAQATGRPDLGVNAAQKAVNIVTEASLGQKNMEVACAYAVLGAALHATGDVGAALREYRLARFLATSCRCCITML